MFLLKKFLMKEELRGVMAERVNTVEGELNARGLRFGVVASKFNDFIVNRLVGAAIDTLIKKGADVGDIKVVRVPGAFEIPLALKKLASSKRYDALIALGCVIRGDTPHFEFVAGEAARGVSEVSLTHEIPVSFGILTVDVMQQGIERAGTKADNYVFDGEEHKKPRDKGVDAAVSAIEMATLLRQLEH